MFHTGIAPKQELKSYAGLVKFLIILCNVYASELTLKLLASFEVEFYLYITLIGFSNSY